MNCSNIFSDFLGNCSESITVNSFLDPGTQYKWVITDKFQKQYSGYSTTDADGHFEIPIEDLPDGLLTSYSGEFELEVFEAPVYGEEACHKALIPMAGNYDKIVFEIRAGSNVKSNLGCDV